MALSGRQGRTYTFPFRLVLSDGPTDGWINRWTDLIELRVRIEKKDQVTEQTAKQISRLTFKSRWTSRSREILSRILNYLIGKD